MSLAGEFILITCAIIIMLVILALYKMMTNIQNTLLLMWTKMWGVGLSDFTKVESILSEIKKDAKKSDS